MLENKISFCLKKKAIVSIQISHVLICSWQQKILHTDKFPPMILSQPPPKWKQVLDKYPNSNVTITDSDF